MKTGIELIKEEREKQINKHGFTAEHHANNPQYYDMHQLVESANILSSQEIVNPKTPTNWEDVWFNRLCSEKYKKRLTIAGALLAAELDRLNYIEENK